MTLYHLQLRDGATELTDEEGAEFENVEAMHKSVLATVRDLIAGDAQDGVINLAHRIDVESPAGNIVHTLAFEDAVTLTRGSGAAVLIV